MYIPPWHNTPVPGSDTPMTPRSLLVTSAVSAAFALSGGLAAVNGLRAAEQLEARPDINEARFLQAYIPESPSHTIADAAYAACREKLDTTRGCLEKNEIAITAQRLKEFSGVAVLASTMALVIAGAAAGGSGAGGGSGGSSGGPGGTRRERQGAQKDAPQPYVPPLTIV